MKNFCIAVACLAFASVPISAKADLILDDFSHGAPINLVDGVSDGTFATQTGALSADVQAGAQYEYAVDGGNLFTGLGGFTTFTGLTGSQFRLTYSLLPNLDLHSTGAFAANPLALNLGTVTGDLTLVASYSGAGAGPVAFAPVALTDGSSGPVFLDGRSIGNGLLASNVTDIELLFTVDAVNGGTNSAGLSIADASIAAVPEPMSLALLGLTGAGSAFVVRRRRRQVATA